MNGRDQLDAYINRVLKTILWSALIGVAMPLVSAIVHGERGLHPYVKFSGPATVAVLLEALRWGLFLGLKIGVVLLALHGLNSLSVWIRRRLSSVK